MSAYYAQTNPNRRRNIGLTIVGIILAIVLLAGCGLGANALLNRDEATSVDPVNNELVEVCAMAEEKGIALAECSDRLELTSADSGKTDSPTWVVDGKTVPFPQTAEEFLNAVARPCPEDDPGDCVELLPADIVADERDEDGNVITWIWSRGADEAGNYRYTYVENVGDLMQNGFMRPPFRHDCGLSQDDLNFLGPEWRRGIAAGIPGHSPAVPVEGFSFFSSPPLAKLAEQTWDERCDGTEDADVVESIDHEGILEVQSTYTREMLVAEFDLDESQIVVTNEGVGCWNVQSLKPGETSFALVNGRGVQLDGWRQDGEVGIPSGFSGQVFGFSVCGPAQ